jgi:hypothetical protein
VRGRGKSSRGLLAPEDFRFESGEIASLAMRHAIPAVYTVRAYVEPEAAHLPTIWKAVVRIAQHPLS